MLVVGHSGEGLAGGDLDIRAVPDPADIAATPGEFDAWLVRLDWPAERNAAEVRRWRERAGRAHLLLLARPDRMRLAVEALQLGADDYLAMPPDGFELRARLGRLWDRSELHSQRALVQQDLARRTALKPIESRSPAMRNVLDRVGRVAPMRSTVLIYGESGVGKELIARAIHLGSTRADRPFIALNCAAISASLIETELFGHERGAFTGAHALARGKFEVAHRGTLFLDEIGEMEAGTQAKLLRVLEEREFMRVGGTRSIRVDVRVIAATNAPLERMVEEGRFRQDLYYRLKVVTIRVPPLRERRGDIPGLVERFLEQIATANALPGKRLERDALEALRDHSWPGNVRELKNVLESLLISTPGPTIGLDALPPSIRAASTPAEVSALEPGTTIAEMECELIRRTLEHTGGNRTHAASLLGIGVRTLQRKIHTYELDIPSRRRRRRTRRT